MLLQGREQEIEERGFLTTIESSNALELDNGFNQIGVHEDFLNALHVKQFFCRQSVDHKT